MEQIQTRIVSKQYSLDNSMAIMPQITRILRERIIQSDLKPGDRLSESEVAKVYEVSRQPVREAFIRLSDQGLVSVLPQRGTIVSRIRYDGVLDSRFLREAIEADVVMILAEQSDAALVRELKSQIAQQKAVDKADSFAFMQLDDQFHRTLADAAGKSGVWKQIEGLKSQMDRVRFLSFEQFPFQKLVDQHEQIVNQIAEADIVGASRAMRIHLREVLSDLPQIVRRNEAFFELTDNALSVPVNTPILGGKSNETNT